MEENEEVIRLTPTKRVRIIQFVINLLTLGKGLKRYPKFEL